MEKDCLMSEERRKPEKMFRWVIALLSFIQIVGMAWASWVTTSLNTTILKLNTVEVRSESVIEALKEIKQELKEIKQKMR